MSEIRSVGSDVVAALEARVRAAAGAPLLVWYGPGDERVELSAATVANWADKVANLLDDEGLDEDSTVAAPLLAAHPAHWQSAVVLLGCWQLGCAVALSGPADLGFVGPGQAAEAPVVVATDLHPLGLGRPAGGGALDFGDVRLQPDAHQRRPWREDLASPMGVALPRSDRRLVTPGEPWPTLRDAVVAPVLGGGSTVLVEGDPEPERLARIAAAEHARPPAAG